MKGRICQDIARYDWLSEAFLLTVYAAFALFQTQCRSAMGMHTATMEDAGIFRFFQNIQ